MSIIYNSYQNYSPATNNTKSTNKVSSSNLDSIKWEEKVAFTAGYTIKILQISFDHPERKEKLIHELKINAEIEIQNKNDRSRFLSLLERARTTRSYNDFTDTALKISQTYWGQIQNEIDLNFFMLGVQIVELRYGTFITNKLLNTGHENIYDFRNGYKMLINDRIDVLKESKFNNLRSKLNEILTILPNLYSNFSNKHKKLCSLLGEIENVCIIGDSLIKKYNILRYLDNE